MCIFCLDFCVDVLAVDWISVFCRYFCEICVTSTDSSVDVLAMGWISIFCKYFCEICIISTDHLWMCWQWFGYLFSVRYLYYFICGCVCSCPIQFPLLREHFSLICTLYMHNHTDRHFLKELFTCLLFSSMLIHL